MIHDAAANPQHCNSADEGNDVKNGRHGHDEAASEGSQNPQRRFLAHMQTNVVDFHQKRDDAIDNHGKQDGHDRQNSRARPEVIDFNCRQRDGHDLG